jgi:CRP-like cAMP-binding protein
VVKYDYIPKGDRTGELKPSSQAQLEKTLEVVPLFRNASRKERALVARLADVTQYVAGATLTREGDKGESMYVLLQGAASISRDGHKVVDVGPGAVIGELALLTDEPRNATVKITDLSEIARIGRKEFAKLVDSSPTFTRKLLISLANRLRARDEGRVI